MKNLISLSLALSAITLFSGASHALSIGSQIIGKKGAATKVKMEVEVPHDGASALDILFVIDDSGSMAQSQALLASNVTELVRAAKDSGADIHAAVVTTNMDTQPWSAKPGASWKGIFAGAGKKVAATADGDFDKVLTENLQAAMTTDGSGTEQPFLAIQTALSEPLLSTTNAGFLRESAALAILVLTDADDQSLMPVADFVKALKALKTKAPVTMHAAYVPSAEVESASCTRSGEPAPVRIEEALKAMGTVTESVSLCDPAFGTKIKQIGEGYKTAELRTVQLKVAPILQTVAISYGTENFDRGDLTFGWAYNSAKQEIVFGDKINWLSQPEGTPVVIEYTAK